MLHYILAATVGDIGGLAFNLNGSNYLLTVAHSNCRMRGSISILKEGRQVFQLAPCYLEWKTKLDIHEEARNDFVIINFVSYFVPSMRNALAEGAGINDENNMFKTLANSNWFFIKFSIERLLIWPMQDNCKTEQYYTKLHGKYVSTYDPLPRLVEAKHNKTTQSIDYVMDGQVVHNSNKAINWAFSQQLLDISLKEIMEKKPIQIDSRSQSLFRPTLDEDDLNLSLKAHQRRKTAVWNLYAKNIDKRQRIT